MKRYSHIILMTAWVLVVVMTMTAPVSAATWKGNVIDLSGYLVNRTVNGAVTTEEYAYTGVYGDTTTLQYKAGSNSYNYGSASSCEVTLTNYSGVFFYYAPAFLQFMSVNPKAATDTSYLFDVASFVSSKDITSSKFLMSFLLSSTKDVVESQFSVNIYGFSKADIVAAGKVDQYPSNHKVSCRNVQKLSFGANEYYQHDVEIDILDLVTNTDVDCFTVYVQWIAGIHDTGDFLSFSNIAPPGSADDLNSGFRIKNGYSKTIDAPVFSSSLKSEIDHLTKDGDIVLRSPATVTDGGTVSYQWYSGSSVSGASKIPGATYASYTIDGSVVQDKYYYCVATNTNYGLTKSRNSNSCHVRIVDPPVAPQIMTNLTDGAVIEYQRDKPAAPLVFTALVTDNGTLSFQWYVRDEAGNTSMIPDATFTSYAPPTNTDGMFYYYCVATNTKASFTASTTSGVLGIRVVPPPDPAKAPVITADLSTTPVKYKEGSAASPLRFGAESPDGGELKYQWYSGSGQVLAGEIYPSFTPPTATPGEYTYYCVVTNHLLGTSKSVTSSRATVVVEKDKTESLLDTIIGGISDMIDGILNLPQRIIDGIKNMLDTIIGGISDMLDAVKNLPQLILDGIKSLFVPDAEAMAAYQDKWYTLMASRFGAVYEAVVLIDQFGESISEQTKQGIVTFPQVTLDLAGTPWTFGGWEVKVVPDGFDAVIVTLKSAINIVCTFAFVNGLRHRFEGIMGGA